MSNTSLSTGHFTVHEHVHQHPPQQTGHVAAGTCPAQSISSGKVE